MGEGIVSFKSELADQIALQTAKIDDQLANHMMKTQELLSAGLNRVNLGDSSGNGKGILGVAPGIAGGDLKF